MTKLFLLKFGKIFELSLEHPSHHVSFKVVNGLPLKLAHHFLEATKLNQSDYRVLTLHQSQGVKVVVI